MKAQTVFRFRGLFIAAPQKIPLFTMYFVRLKKTLLRNIRIRM